MNGPLWTAAAYSVGLVLAATLLLVGVKVAHWRALRARARRRAIYTASLADLLATGFSTRRIRRAGRDPVFFEVVHDYLGIVDGHELQRLQLLIDHIDLRGRLRRQARIAPTIGRRLAALHLLAVIARPADEDFFLSRLRSRSASERLGAVRGLAAIRSLRGLDRTLDLLDEETPARALLLADSMIGFGPAAVPSVAGRLEDPRVTQRALLIRVLGLIGDPEAAGAVVSFLIHADPEVRIAAASSLGRVGTTETIPRLIAAGGDDDWRVRGRVASSLGDLGASEAVPLLTGLLEDPGWWVRQHAARSLARLPGGEDVLLGALDSPDRFAADAAREQLELMDPARSAAALGAPT